MTRDLRRPAPHARTTRFLVPTLLLPVVLSGLTTSAGAAGPQPGEDATILSDSQIVEALHPETTRGFKPRGLTRHGTAEAAQSVNLNVPFEHNSSALQPQASAQLKQLQLALTSAALREDRFVVAGHTDAKGSPQYNKQLSLRRAEAVKRFLVAGGVAAARLDAVGFGSEQLLAPDQPEDPRNRRVEIRDIGRPSP